MKGEKRWRREKSVGGAGGGGGGRNRRHGEGVWDFPTAPAEPLFLIRGPAGLSWVFLVIHLLFGQAAPQQVGGLVNGPKHGAYETN
jgi:hypothetical protein